MKLSEKLWSDLKTDEERAAWLRLGRGYETGVVAIAIQQELAMAYERLVGYKNAIAEEREACVQIIEEYRIPVGNSAAGELACEWTYEALAEIVETIHTEVDARASKVLERVGVPRRIHLCAEEREACVQIIEQYRIPVGNSAAGELACKWTYEALAEIVETIRARGKT